MIQVINEQVKAAIKEIHEGVSRKMKRTAATSNNIILESRLFALLCDNHTLQPSKCAAMLNDIYGYELTGDRVIQVLRKLKMSNPAERKELLDWTKDVVNAYEKAITGDKTAFEYFEKRRHESPYGNDRRHNAQDRIVAVRFFAQNEEFDIFGDGKILENFGNVLARYVVYDMADAISNVYGFEQKIEDTKKKTVATPVTEKIEKPQMSMEQAMRKISQLETMLERTSNMLQDLQDEFREQIEESKAQERAEFFAMLNSDKYGCILDELLVIRRGVDELRKTNYELPMELNGILILVKKMIQFVKDNHMDPIMKVNSVREVTAADVELCIYEGSAFMTPEEKKQVKVISPGWMYKDKEIQISRPKVKEL